MIEARALVIEADALRQVGRHDEAYRKARRAVGLRVGLKETLPALARAMEAKGDLNSALEIYGQAMAHEPAFGAERGRLALRMGKYDLAEEMLVAHMQTAPPAAEAIADLALAQAMLKAYDRAHATLTAALKADGSQPLVWLALARVLCLEGRHAQSIVFFEEALRLDPALPRALDGLADALLLTGDADVERALAMSEAALAEAAPEDIPALTAAHARRLLATGRVAAGWAAFAEGLEPGEAAAVEVKIAAPLWAPGTPLDGWLLLLGEESVADTVLLAQVIPSALAAGPPVILSLGSRWDGLVRRSFPEATTTPLLSRKLDGRRQKTADLDGPLVHQGDLLGAWAPLRSMMKSYRARVADFGDALPYLKADAGRVDYWREWLSARGSGLKVGVLWRAPEGARDRAWEAPPLPLLQEALNVPGVELIGVQEEAVMNELGWIRGSLKFPIQDGPLGLHRGDLDDLAALTLALDVVIGPPDTTSFLAAACGAETWFLTPPRHWALLGGETFPWFPKAKVISAAAPDDWSDAMAELHAALEAMSSKAASSLSVNPASSR